MNEIIQKEVILQFIKNSKIQIDKTGEETYVFSKAQFESFKNSLSPVNISVSDIEREKFVKFTVFVNLQNLNGREDDEEIFEKGIEAGFDDLLFLLNGSEKIV